MYWTKTFENGTTTIETSQRDGSNLTTFISSADLAKVKALTVDPWEKALYWIDTDSIQGRFRIERALLDGTGEREVVCTGRDQEPFDLAVSRDRLVWTDWKNLAVWMLDKAQEICSPVVVKRTESSRPMGLAFAGVTTECKDQVRPRTKNISARNLEEQDAHLPGPGPCYNFCHVGNCSVTSIGVPVCFCEPGFVGDRCQTDLCHNYCFGKGSKCSIDASTGMPRCTLCPGGAKGQRCQETDFVPE